MSTATERLLGAATLAALLWGVPAAAQPARGAGPAAGTATRAVAHYLDLERGLADAVAAGDEAAVMQRLAGDFESRPAGMLDPVGAGPWMRDEFARHTPARVRELAVREAGTAIIVSFVRDLGGHPSRTEYIVDVWQADGDRLLARYSAPMSRPALARPSGRE